MALEPDRDYTVELGLDEPDDPASLVRKLAAQLEERIALYANEEPFVAGSDG